MPRAQITPSGCPPEGRPTQRRVPVITVTTALVSALMRGASISPWRSTRTAMRGASSRSSQSDLALHIATGKELHCYSNSSPPRVEPASDWEVEKCH